IEVSVPEVIRVYSQNHLDLLRESAEIAKSVLSYALKFCQAGITTLEIDKEIRYKITALGGVPAFLGYQGFPYSSCISVNQYIVHGVPSNRPLEDGDVVSVDL